MSTELPIKDNDRYTAGSSVFYLNNDNINAKDIKNRWSKCEADSFSLRVGPDYSKNKLKSPSAKALYDAVGIEYTIII